VATYAEGLEAIVIVERIISGGQTGVDRAGLDIAIRLNIPCGGWCPTDRRSEDGVIPDQYPLTETSAKNYTKRMRIPVKMNTYSGRT